MEKSRESLLYLFNDFIDSLAIYYPPEQWGPTLKKKYRNLATKVFSDDPARDV